MLKPLCSRNPQDRIHHDMCEDAKRRNFKNEIFEDSFLSHYFAATWMDDNKQVSERVLKKDETVSMFDIVPGLVKVGEKFGLKC